MRTDRVVRRIPKDVCSVTGKVCFPNYTDATSSIKHGLHNPRLSRRQNGVKFEVYICRYCNYFHIGRRNRTQMEINNKRIRKIEKLVK